MYYGNTVLFKMYHGKKKKKMDILNAFVLLLIYLFNGAMVIQWLLDMDHGNTVFFEHKWTYINLFVCL